MHPESDLPQLPALWIKCLEQASSNGGTSATCGISERPPQKQRE